MPPEVFVGTTSVTQPDQVKHLDEILRRRQSGIHPEYFNGGYNSLDTADVQKMDFVELAQYREETKQHIQALNEDYHYLTHQLEEQRKAHQESSKADVPLAPAAMSGKPPEEDKKP